MANYKKFISKKELIEANEGRKITDLDYIHAMFSLSGIPVDVAMSFSKVFTPDLKVIDGVIFLSDGYDDELKRSYYDKKIEKAQFWINLIEITGIFENMTLFEAERFADAVVFSWNSIIISKYSLEQGRARRITDEGEVFVTID